MRLAPVLRPDAAAEGVIKSLFLSCPPTVAIACLLVPDTLPQPVACWHDDRSPARPVGAPDLACFVAPPPPARLYRSAPNMLLAIARRIGSAARPPSQLPVILHQG